MASGDPSSMMATTERPLTDVDCFDNPPLLDEKEEKDLANGVREKVILDSKISKLGHDRYLIPHNKDRYSLTDEAFEAYQKEVDDSDGFDVGHYVGALPGMIVRQNHSKEELAEHFTGHAESALYHYNKKTCAKFKVVGIEKANYAPFTHFITFTAVDENALDPIVFQASLSYQVKGGLRVNLCRQKGNPGEGYDVTVDSEDDEEEEEYEEEDEKVSQPISQ